MKAFYNTGCGSENFLVTDKLKIRLNKIEISKENHSELLDVQKLGDPKVCEKFHTSIQNERKKEQLYLDRLMI